MPRVILAVALAGTLAVGPTATQEHPRVPTHPGAWQPAPPITPRMPPDVSVAERTAIAASVNQILEIAQRMPDMAPPAGLAVIPHVFIDIQNLDHSEGKRFAYVTAEVVLNLAPFEQIGRGAIEAVEADSAAIVTFRINDVGPLLGSEIGLSDDQGAFIENPPEPVDTLQGHPVYEEGNGDRWIMIRGNDVPFFAPVTADRYMRATIASTERELSDVRERRARVPAGVPASVIATLDDAIAGIEPKLKNTQDALAAMSAADRAAPARLASVTAQDAPVFAAADETGATAVVYFNPALMTPGLARTVPQLLAVSIRASDDAWPGLKAKLNTEIDWAALEKFVRQR